ncbi:hypothetical protein UYO_3056, partial [Lachnospiraceae bacterium JC7]
HVLCRVISGEFRENDETTERGYFRLDNLPELNEKKTNEQEIKLCLKAFRSEQWNPVID